MYPGLVTIAGVSVSYRADYVAFRQFLTSNSLYVQYLHARPVVSLNDNPVLDGIERNRMLPLTDTVPSRTFPAVNWALLAANVIVFLLMVGNERLTEAWAATLALVPARFLANPLDPTQLLTIFTSMFMHGGWFHLFSNMLALYIFGDNVEDRMGVSVI